MPYFNQNSTLQQPITVTDTEPTTTKEGLTYFDTTVDSLRIYVNGEWVVAVAGAGSDGPFDFMNGEDMQYMNGENISFMAS